MRFLSLIDDGEGLLEALKARTPRIAACNYICFITINNNLNNCTDFLLYQQLRVTLTLFLHIFTLNIGLNSEIMGGGIIGAKKFLSSHLNFKDVFTFGFFFRVFGPYVNTTNDLSPF